VRFTNENFSLKSERHLGDRSDRAIDGFERRSLLSLLRNNDLARHGLDAQYGCGSCAVLAVDDREPAPFHRRNHNRSKARPRKLSRFPVGAYSDIDSGGGVAGAALEQIPTDFTHSLRA
jgi:hypothetical protein